MKDPLRLAEMLAIRLCHDLSSPLGTLMGALELASEDVESSAEALRLADLNGQYQEQAAEQMKISRATFARIVEVARKKVADALINGKALRIQGGPVVIKGDNAMPAGQGKGNGQGGGRGMGRGPCGCGQRRGQRGQGRGLCQRNPSESAPAADTTERRSIIENTKGK